MHCECCEIYSGDSFVNLINAAEKRRIATMNQYGMDVYIIGSMICADYEHAKEVAKKELLNLLSNKNNELKLDGILKEYYESVILKASIYRKEGDSDYRKESSSEFNNIAVNC